MKELKFRAMVKERNNLIYFTLNDLINPTRQDILKDLLPWLIQHHFTGVGKIDLYIDRKDKNGKEVYWGDIVMLSDGSMYVVEYGSFDNEDWDSPQHGYGPYFQHPRTKDDVFPINAFTSIEVKGNIHENPGLIG